MDEDNVDVVVSNELVVSEWQGWLRGEAEHVHCIGAAIGRVAWDADSSRQIAVEHPAV